MLCLSVDIGLMLAVSNIFLFSLLQSIVFFSVIIILFQTCIFSSSIPASPMSFVHFIGAPWFLSIFSLYSQFLFVPDFGSSLSYQDTQRCFSQSIWCTSGDTFISVEVCLTLGTTFQLFLCFSSCLLMLPICCSVLHTFPIKTHITPIMHT